MRVEVGAYGGEKHNMKLEFKSRHLSIEAFEPVELPDFTVLTGVNGAGKSHLMHAIEAGFVAIAGIQNPLVVHFNYETFRLENEQAFNAHQLSSERESAWQYHQQHFKGAAQNWRTSIGPTYGDLKAECERSNRSLWSLPTEEVRSYRKNFKDYLSTNRKIRQNQHAQGIFSLAKRIPCSIDELDHEDFLRLYKPYSFKGDFLPFQLGKVFWDYYVKYRGNQVNEYQNEKYGKSYEAVDEQTFTSIHGERPWEVVNEILKSFDSLKYRVTSPEGSDYFGNFHLKLRHTERSDLEVEFSSLSSGERVLMALVASVYKTATDRHFPDVLLLDEVDASLHPSMMKNMLDVIERIFLRQGVKVILVTHSPTTIALAPDESIFVMNRAGSERIAHKSKVEALAILTQGFATIEQGLKLFDEVAKSNINIITEGRNARLISRALTVHGIHDVEVVTGVEGISGKDQLRTLFHFFAKARHDKKVVFVWDCDVKQSLVAENNTFPLALPTNESNQLARRGIENAFSERLFENFIKTVTSSKGESSREFDVERKRDFESYVLSRDNPEDFAGFSWLAGEINRIRAMNQV